MLVAPLGMPNATSGSGALPSAEAPLGVYSGTPNGAYAAPPRRVYPNLTPQMIPPLSLTLLLFFRIFSTLFRPFDAPCYTPWSGTGAAPPKRTFPYPTPHTIPLPPLPYLLFSLSFSSFPRHLGAPGLTPWNGALPSAEAHLGVYSGTPHGAYAAPPRRVLPNLMPQTIPPFPLTL